MLVLEKAGLVFLANPKTATQSLRTMLAPFAQATPKGTEHKHINAQTYDRIWASRIARKLGTPAQTVAVMREPLEHLGSWFRYRQRDALRGHENSTKDLTFAEFVAAQLSEDPPPFARIGRQDRFLGFLNSGPAVTYIFDHTDLSRLVDFLASRLDAKLSLPRRNVSFETNAADLMLPADLLAQFQTAHATEFALYDRVRQSGMLHTAAPRGAVVE
ncbi:MAG: gamma-glutamyl kinase [Paracoccaceae bacterium]